MHPYKISVPIYDYLKWHLPTVYKIQFCCHCVYKQLADDLPIPIIDRYIGASQTLMHFFSFYDFLKWWDCCLKLFLTLITFRCFHSTAKQNIWTDYKIYFPFTDFSKHMKTFRWTNLQTLMIFECFCVDKPSVLTC